MFDAEENVFVTAPQQAVSFSRDETAQSRNSCSTTLSWPCRSEL